MWEILEWILKDLYFFDVGSGAGLLC